MKRLNFKCTLLDDIIVSAKTATEGEHQSLNFIPGAKFLGILAAEVYDNNNPASYTLFHSGKVRFGDAHIVSNGIRSYQIPFMWYYPKGGKLTTNENYMLNFMSNKNFNKLISDGVILKQARDGYFTEGGDYISFVKKFSQKTAYDSDNRRSAESEMFGYEALQGGSEWHFHVDVDNGVDREIFNKLTGEKRLGRSKTAEFGRTRIEFIKEDSIKTKEIALRKTVLEYRTVKNAEASYETKEISLVLLYAESRLAFRNEYGQPTFTPTPEQLGLPEDSKILWERSQIRTGVYAPWNFKRASRDEDRVFIEKGSIFVINVNKSFTDESFTDESFTDEAINKGVGLYCTEGFGQLLVNPNFLVHDSKTGKLNLQLKDRSHDDTPIDPSIPDDDLVRWIRQQNNDLNEALILVDYFIRTYTNQFKSVANSQWGNIRSLSLGANSKTELMKSLFEKPGNGNNGGYLMHGIALDQWKNGVELLKKMIQETEENIVLQFVEKLAARMQKKGGVK